MAHNIDMTNGRANIAFLGSREDVWHRLGQEMAPGQTIEEWAAAAGLNWHAVKVQAVAVLAGNGFQHLPQSEIFREVEGQKFVVRSDNGQPLGYVSDMYQPVQPRETLEWFQRYVGVDDRFQIDCAGSLKKGEIIWCTAKFRESLDVVGEAHTARLLMTTTFDASGATINKGTMTRVVCNNTLDAALGSDKRAVIKTRHNTRFDADRVHRELSTIISGFNQYKAMAEAMVAVDMSKTQVSEFFKACLDIPFDAKESDISGRKMGQFRALTNAYADTVSEGTKPLSAWAALNSVTRYVDHERSTRNATNGVDEARVISANFGSGAALKQKAIGLLLPDFRVPELVAA